jgi:hypothetical protein
MQKKRTKKLEVAFEINLRILKFSIKWTLEL